MAENASNMTRTFVMDANTFSKQPIALQLHIHSNALRNRTAVQSPTLSTCRSFNTIQIKALFKLPLIENIRKPFPAHKEETR